MFTLVAEFQAIDLSCVFQTKLSPLFTYIRTVSLFDSDLIQVYFYDFTHLYIRYAI